MLNRTDWASLKALGRTLAMLAMAVGLTLLWVGIIYWGAPLWLLSKSEMEQRARRDIAWTDVSGHLERWRSATVGRSSHKIVLTLREFPLDFEVSSVVVDRFNDDRFAREVGPGDTLRLQVNAIDWAAANAAGGPAKERSVDVYGIEGGRAIYLRTEDSVAEEVTNMKLARWITLAAFCLLPVLIGVYFWLVRSGLSAMVRRGWRTR